MIPTPYLDIRELPKTKKMMMDEKNHIFKIRKNKFSTDEQEHLADISTIYGSAMSMMLRHERAILGQPERLPGLRSSFMALQSNMGRLTKLEFEDVFGSDKKLMKANAHDVYLSQFDK